MVVPLKYMRDSRDILVSLWGRLCSTRPDLGHFGFEVCVDTIQACGNTRIIERLGINKSRTSGLSNRSTRFQVTWVNSSSGDGNAAAASRYLQVHRSSISISSQVYCRSSRHLASTMDRSEVKKPQKQDVVDEAEYARYVFHCYCAEDMVSRCILDRALRATMHIRSPDRSRSGSAANFGPQRSEDEDLAK
jgi:hypothetical protein